MEIIHTKRTVHDTSDRNSTVHGAGDMITDYAGQELHVQVAFPRPGTCAHQRSVSSVGQVAFLRHGTSAPCPASDDVLVCTIM